MSTFNGRPFTRVVTRNLVKNPKVATATGYSASTNGSGVVTTYTYAASIPDVPELARAFRGTLNVFSVPGDYIDLRYSVDVVAGETYSAAVWTRSAAKDQNCKFQTQWADSSGAYISANILEFTSQASVWSRQVIENAVAPAGAVTMRVTVRYWPSAGSAAWVDVTGLVVEKAAALSPGLFFDGDTPDTPAADFEWSGDANASESVMLAATAADTIEPVLVSVPWRAARQSRTVLHPLLGDPSQTALTWFPPSPRQGQFIALFDTPAAAAAAADRFAAVPVWSFDPPAAYPEMGVMRFCVTPGGQVTVGDTDQVALVTASGKRRWQLTVPWTEVSA